MAATATPKKRRRRRKPNKPPNRTSKWITPERRAAIYRRDGMRCVYCKRGVLRPVPSSTGVIEGLALDHVVSRMDGGGNESTNIVTACSDCNRAKSERSLDDWAAEMPAAKRQKVIRTVEQATSRGVDLEDGKRFMGTRAARPCRS